MSFKKLLFNFLITMVMSQSIFTSLNNDALFNAIESGNPRAVQVTLEDPIQRMLINQNSDYDGETPLYHAMWKYHINSREHWENPSARAIIKELLKHEALVYIPNRNGFTAKDIKGETLGKTSADIINEILKEIEQEKQKSYTYTPGDSLFNYIKASNLRGVKDYIRERKQSKQDNPDVAIAIDSDEFGNTPLHIALKTNNPSLEIIQELLILPEIQNLITTENIYAETPLYLAKLAYTTFQNSTNQKIIELLQKTAHSITHSPKYLKHYQ